MILISKCLAGFNCKYNGGNNTVPEIRQLYEEGKAVAVCPEQLGGLSTPRIPSECRGDRVVNRAGEDVTEAFEKGAELALKTAREHACRTAVLKARSPSCGLHEIYDGTFSGRLVSGNGVFARKCLEKGMQCFTENEYKEIEL